MYGEYMDPEHNMSHKLNSQWKKMHLQFWYLLN